MQSKHAALGCALAAACLQTAAAQQPAREPVTDPRATVPAPRYESAFTGYRAFRDEKLAPWRDVNDEVARIGGHVGIVGGAAGHAAHGGGKPSAVPPQRKP